MTGLAHDTALTCLRWAIGISLGTAFALLLYLVGLAHPRLRSVLIGVADFLRAIPIIALVPLFFLLFAFAERGKFAMIAWATSLPIYMGIVHAAVPDPDRKLTLSAAGFGRAEMMRWLYVPTLAQALCGAFRVAMGIGWISVVAAESLGILEGGHAWSGGLGDRVTRMGQIPDYLGMTIGLFVFGLLGLTSAVLYNRGIALFRRLTGVDLG